MITHTCSLQIIALNLTQHELNKLRRQYRKAAREHLLLYLNQNCLNRTTEMNSSDSPPKVHFQPKVTSTPVQKTDRVEDENDFAKLKELVKELRQEVEMLKREKLEMEVCEHRRRSCSLADELRKAGDRVDYLDVPCHCKREKKLNNGKRFTFSTL